MKNLFIAIIMAFGFTAISCNAVSNAKTAQANRSEFLKLKGNWEIVNIEYDKQYKIKPFDENADASCFIGSQWSFIPNNYSGSYTLNGGENCPSIKQPIKFEVKDGNSFLFKKVMEGTKAKQNTVGYQLNVVSMSDAQLVLEQNVPFEGSFIKVLYSFRKTN